MTSTISWCPGDITRTKQNACPLVLLHSQIGTSNLESLLVMLRSTHSKSLLYRLMRG
ncbi:MAG TPA: hypothetical protein VK900_16040 [Anaerolineales bacterium]|nr:hypothetical protein [Anaerolineales bacterium]